MSKTGRYIYDEGARQVVKVSDDIPVLPGKVWYPKGGYAYFDKALQKKFYSMQEKRDYMKIHGIVEAPQVESEKKKDSRCAEVINYSRVEQGLKPKTVTELKGG